VADTADAPPAEPTTPAAGDDSATPAAVPPPPRATSPLSKQAEVMTTLGANGHAGLLYLRAHDETKDPEQLLLAGVAFLRIDSPSARAAAVQALRRYLLLVTDPAAQQRGKELLSIAEGRLNTPVHPPEHSADSLAGMLGRSPVAPRPASDRSPRDLSPGRTVYVDTAYLPDDDTFTWQSLNVGLHEFGYTVHDNVQLSATTSVPAGFFGVIPKVKVAGPVADGVDLAIMASGGIVGFFFGDVPAFFGFGGGAMASFGDPDLHLTVGTLAYGAGTTESPDALAYLVYPYVGGAVRVANAVKLNFELGPALLGAAQGLIDPGKIWPISYGVRFHGEHFFGDVGFIIPASEGWFDNLAMYMPLGVPLLMFGYSD